MERGDIDRLYQISANKILWFADLKIEAIDVVLGFLNGLVMCLFSMPTYYEMLGLT